MRKRKPEDALDGYLADRTIPDDSELASLTRVADRLERGLNVEAPDAFRERALFIQGIAARKPGFPWGRLLAPIMTASVLIAFIAIGRDARPGDVLYGFRKTLDKVGLAENPARTAREVLDRAEEQVAAAETSLDNERYEPARRGALKALVTLDDADELLEDGSGEFLETQTERYEDLTETANDVLYEAIEGQIDREEEQLENAQERAEEQREREEENSGKAGDDSGGDRSGRGGDDSGRDDHSGSGGVDSSHSGSDDSSGSGSDDSGGDSSGSGSDDSGGDSSGSGSDDSGGDSSGSGSDDG